MSRTFRLFLLAGGALLVVSCGDTVVRRNVIVLVDYSASERDQLNRHATVLAHDVIENLEANDAISVFPIDAAAVTKNVRLSGFDLRQQVFARQTDGVTHRSDSVRVRVSAFLRTAGDSVLHSIAAGRDQRQQFTNRTDILGALEGVVSVLERVRPVAPLAALWNTIAGQSEFEVQNVVIIFSDMINESADADFETRVPTVKNVNALIADLRRRRKLPDLREVVVFVTGRTGRDARQVDDVHEFWVRYFAAAGADLRAYDYDGGTHLRQFFSHP